LHKKETWLIGKVVERLRRERRMSQEELAFESGISREFLIKIETNKSEPGLGTTSALAYALGMRPNELVKIIEESPNTEFGTRKNPNSEQNQ
jgi:transcriptional regulator with XRE-family HTH domain